MRIDALAEISQVYQANGKKKAVNGSGSSYSKDRVEISSFGRELQVARQAVAQSEDIRAEKVQEIKTRMANGTYNVPMGALADKLLAQSGWT